MNTNTLRKLMAATVCLAVGAGGLFAQNAADELEKGVQQQETEGDLDAAIRHFQAVLRADGKIEKLAAEARYRLLRCYLAKGDSKKAREQADALRNDYPADNRWVQKALALVPQETKFGGVPWTDGKAYRYSVRLPNGNEVGQFVTATRKIEADGEAAWESVWVRAAGTYSLSRSRFAEEGYRSIDCRWYMRGMGDVTSVFGKDGIVRLIDSETGAEKDTFDSTTRKASDTPLYENEQLVQLMRALSTKVGTKQKTVLISGLNGAATVAFDMEVTAHEEIEVPAGTFECAKIETNLKQTFFIEAEGDHRLVKIALGPANCVLTDEFDWDGASPVQAGSENFGCSLRIPGAVLAMPVVDNDEVFRQQYWSTDFAGRDGLLEVNWTKNLVPEAKGSSRACAEHMVGLMGKNYEEWGAVEGSWEEVEVGGVPGVAVRAKGVQGEITVREYHVYALGEEKTVIFRMNYGPKEQKAARERALELVKSLKWETE